MVKMQMETAQQPSVKLECLRMLNPLELDPARTQLISGFIDIYLRLNPEEEAAFQEQLSAILPIEQEEVMEIVTSWMEKGIEQGRQEAMQQEALLLVQRLLNLRLGTISPELYSAGQQLSKVQLEALTEALLDFSSEADLGAWLRNHRTTD
ncbi:DUF4351 domain-containing protein [Phormidium sp. CCY1219]|uniref:DUF4351 domain-containing protein n=1 Tax=Phormidium sp. CCY1219 TaxID=2886104 RepID=UPI002D1F6186|nr:DUF4351 domain-containing protein [Phormidium sp. CCY1219]MEB3831845.1 DUF4351 domain-containing protein [Phormidium sp. CCY1219]